MTLLKAPKGVFFIPQIISEISKSISEGKSWIQKLELKMHLRDYGINSNVKLNSVSNHKNELFCVFEQICG